MSNFDQVAMLLLILVPLVGSVLVALFPGERTREAWLFSVLVSSISFALSVIVFIRYDYNAGGFQFAHTYEWLDAPLNIDLALALDGITAPLVLLNGIILLGACLISQTITHRTRDFFVLLLALGSGVFGVFVVQNLFFLFFFYELAVLPMYLLIGVWGSSTDFGTFLRTKEYGAMKLMLYLVAGSVLVWIGILALYVQSAGAGVGTFSIAALGELAQQGAFSEGFQRWVFPLFMVGFGVLAGLWPFHTWSPDGHVAAPTGVSMLHAGVLMKLGAYGIIRVGMVLLPEGAEFWMPVLIILGTVNVLYGAVSAMSQQDLKYVIGYSSVSHMGYVLMGIATLHPVGLSGAVLQMFSHGIMTALMFAMVGAIYERAHIRDINVLNGLMKRMGAASFFFAIAGLASLGLPGLSGFIAEFMIFTGTFRTYLPLAVLAVVGAAITAVYILRLMARTFFGEADPNLPLHCPRCGMLADGGQCGGAPAAALASADSPLAERSGGGTGFPSGGAGPRIREHLTDASLVEKTVGGAFVMVLIFVGIWPGPLLRVINVSVASVLELF